MDKQRYGIVDKTGKNIIVKKDNARYIGIDELAQHIAMDIFSILKIEELYHRK